MKHKLVNGTVVVMIILLTMAGIVPVIVDSLPLRNQSENSTISPVIIMFDSSKEEISAKNELVSNFHQSIIMQFAYDLDLSGIISPIIWIGHGDYSGINFQNEVVSWEILTMMVTYSISNYHFFLSCGSGILPELTIETGKYVYGFENSVDALFGSNIISILLSKLFNTGDLTWYIQKAISRMNILPTDVDYKGLYITGKLGLQEAIVRGTNAILLFSVIFFTTSASIMGGKIATAWAGYASAGMAAWLLYLIFGIFVAAVNGDAGGVLSRLGPFISALFAFGQFVINYVSWLVAAVLAAALGVDLAATPPKMPMYPAIIILAVGASIYECWKFINDYNDVGDVPR